MNGTPYLIHGRADGIIMALEPTIEEIKTSDADFSRLPNSIKKLYWGQVKTYAALLFNQRDSLKRIRLRLTYVRTPQRAVTKKTKLITRTGAQTFFSGIIKEYAKWLRVRQKIVRTRNRTARQLKFPFGKFRPHQRALAAAVYKTIVFKKHLFAEAPTGTGKTISTLFPAVKAMGFHHANRIFYLTAKRSTRHVAEKTVQLMANHGLRLKSLTITAKEQIQFPEEINVDPSQNPDMLGYYDRLRPAVLDILTHQNQITSQIIVKYAKKYRLDPFEFSLDVSDFCDVIICDYNYLFDVQVVLSRFFATRDPGNCFLIDEAHNLVSRSRDMYSASLPSEPLNRLIRTFKSHRPRCHGLLQPARRLKRAFTAERTKLNGRISLNSAQPEKWFNRVVKIFSHAIHKWLPAQLHRDDLTQQVITYYFTCNTYLTINGFYDSTYRTRLIRNPHRQITVRLLCVDPSPHLAKSLKRGGSAVLFSATLSPMSYYQRMLGNEPDSLAYQLPSAFPADHQLVLVTNFIQTTYRNRRQNQPRLVRTIHQFIQGKRGHYLIYFPSYHYLNSVARDFQAAYPRTKMIRQRPGLNISQQNRFIRNFKRHFNRTMVGFAILGSAFSEGIDLKGPALIGVGIVSVGLPKINTETNLVADYFDRHVGRGFEYAYQLPGLNRVLQAAGRLIRSAKDRGIVALMDQRFGFARYRKFIPKHWRIRNVANLTQFKGAVHQFWLGR